MKTYLKGLALTYVIIGAATAVLDLAQVAIGRRTASLRTGAGGLSLLAAVAVYLLGKFAENTTPPSCAAPKAERLVPTSVRLAKFVNSTRSGCIENMRSAEKTRFLLIDLETDDLIAIDHCGHSNSCKCP